MRRIALTDMLRNPRLPSLDRRGKALAYAGTALALAGIGAGTAAAETGGSAGPAAAAPAGIAAQAHDLGIAAPGFGDGSPAATAPSIRHLAADAAAVKPATPAPGGFATAPAAPGTGAAADPTPAAPARPAPARPAPVHAAPVHVVKHTSTSWQKVRDAIARETLPRAKPGTLPMADRLQGGPAQGQQAYMPISAAQMANATTIVRQALHKHMGLRSAVVAVATAMQESTLQNISYGDRDSLGLFQQRPSMGWGSAKQITTPSYAADAFLGALATYQHSNPQWAEQPLWATAQAVQRSGFPQAYAKWEAQAAQLVHSIAAHLL